MIRKATIALCLGVSLALSAPHAGWAQGQQRSNKLGSDSGFVSPAHSGVSGLGAKNTVADGAAGSPGSEAETTLSRRGGAEPATREGDVPKQIGILAPVAFFMFLVLAGGLYWFVFRRSSTPEGEAASNGNQNNGATAQNAAPGDKDAAITGTDNR